MPSVPVRIYAVFGVADLTRVGEVYQDMMTERNDTQTFGVSFTEPASSEGNDPLARDLSLGADYEVLLDLDTAEQIRCFSEGRSLLFGV